MLPRLAIAAAIVLCVTACSPSKHSETTTGPVKSPIVVKLPLSQTQSRSPVTVKGTSTLSEPLSKQLISVLGG